MKITQIDVWTVVVPVFPEAVHSEEYGGYPEWARVPKQIIRMHTDEGITGIGETGGVNRHKRWLKRLKN